MQTVWITVKIMCGSNRKPNIENRFNGELGIKTHNGRERQRDNVNTQKLNSK